MCPSLYCIVKMLLEFNMFWTSADLCCKFMCFETKYLLKVGVELWNLICFGLKHLESRFPTTVYINGVGPPADPHPS